jgi:hypothetical protein
MRPIQKLRLASATRSALIVLCAIGFGTAFATDALSAENSGHGANHSGGRMHGGFSAPLSTAPSAPPSFNPYYSYTVPQAPETPVSPTSPGSVFGNN